MVGPIRIRAIQNRFGVRVCRRPAIRSPHEFVGPDLRCLRAWSSRATTARPAPPAGSPRAATPAVPCTAPPARAASGRAPAGAPSRPPVAVCPLPRVPGPDRGPALAAAACRRAGARGARSRPRSTPRCAHRAHASTAAPRRRPLTTSGRGRAAAPEAESNLVPACWSCNPSMGDRLLTEWDAPRVARAAACSQVVTAELARLAAA